MRGLYYQIKQTQGKLVRVVSGEIFDVAVDLRQSPPTFGCYVGQRLTAADHKRLWIPPGLAHGFYVLSESAYYAPAYERSLLWCDPDLGIEWPIFRPPIVLDKDMAGIPFKLADLFE